MTAAVVVQSLGWWCNDVMMAMRNVEDRWHAAACYHSHFLTIILKLRNTLYKIWNSKVNFNWWLERIVCCVLLSRYISTYSRQTMTMQWKSVYDIWIVFLCTLQYRVDCFSECMSCSIINSIGDQSVLGQQHWWFVWCCELELYMFGSQGKEMGNLIRSCQQLSSSQTWQEFLGDRLSVVKQRIHAFYNLSWDATIDQADKFYKRENEEVGPQAQVNIQASQQ